MSKRPIIELFISVGNLKPKLKWRSKLQLKQKCLVLNCLPGPGPAARPPPPAAGPPQPPGTSSSPSRRCAAGNYLSKEEGHCIARVRELKPRSSNESTGARFCKK